MLSENWITDYTLDTEYKQYLALAYIRQTEEYLMHWRLHPHLPDLQQHLQNMYTLRFEQKKMQDFVNKEIKSIDWENKRIIYEQDKELEKIWEPVEAILAFSTPLFEKTLENAKEIEQEIEQNLSFYTLGIEPIYKKEGILLLSDLQSRMAYAFSYTSGLYNTVGGRWISTQTRFLTRARITLLHTLHAFKATLLKNYRTVPTPATFVLESEKKLPIKQTLLPIAVYRLELELV